MPAVWCWAVGYSGNLEQLCAVNGSNTDKEKSERHKDSLIITSTKEEEVGLFGWLVCQQDYTKTIKWICTELAWRTGAGTEENPLTFGADPVDHFL